MRDSGTPPGRFSRTVDLYGESAFGAIRSARVVVAGLGGVGAHAALALARSGVGVLVLCDFDKVTVSSLNRSPLFEPADVGRSKAEVLAERLGRACPDTRCEAREVFLDGETVPAVLEPAPGVVVDAIDSLGPKVGLLAACVRRGVPVVSSMGASARRDAGALREGDVGETSGCPLARLVRQRLRKLGIERGVTCVWSVEPAAAPLPPDGGEETLRRGRVRRRQPSGICLPGIFGYRVAALALERLVRSGPVRP
ncbi:MAG: tRNA threonylcarbamoyladenosine dehydratase [Myxococcales bacterium]|nr:tRNA threonylcarbamoyladenosine dehydratase [Myxococcales bacterium]